jgi:cell division protein ZapA (FtsZ GTPase activity inhibitor)
MSQSEKEWTNISVKIFGREYNIKCSVDEVDVLHQSAELLNQEMNKTASANHILNTDQVAVLTGLNLSNQLLSLKHMEVKAAAHDALQDRLKHLLGRLKNSLANVTEIAV